MIIQCEKCRTKFNIDETFLKDEGSKVKCSRCKHVFVAFPTEQVEAEEQAAVIVGEEETGTLEETTEPELGEETDFDDTFEEESMEDIEDLEDEYPEDSFGLPPEYEIDEEREEEAEEEIPVDTETGEPVPVKKRSGRSQTLLILIVIILALLGIAYALTRWAPELVPDFLTPTKTKPVEQQAGTDMGASRLEILTVNGSFVDSEKAGRLFLIQGKVRNGYPNSRSFILIKGNILDDKGQVVKEKSAYAGNPFEEEQLKKLPLEEINRAMGNRQGIEEKNLNVEPGTTVDFAIVFENLPENLSEFTVGPTSSSPGDAEKNNQT